MAGGQGEWEKPKLVSETRFPEWRPVLDPKRHTSQGDERQTIKFID